MTSSAMTPPQDVTFLCLFHEADRAEKAINALELADFRRNVLVAVDAHPTREDDQAVHRELLALGAPLRDLEHLAAGVLRGGVVICLVAPDSRSQEVERILHRYSAEEIDEVVPGPKTKPGPASDKTAGGNSNAGTPEPPVAANRGEVRVLRRPTTAAD